MKIFKLYFKNLARAAVIPIDICTLGESRETRRKVYRIFTKLCQQPSWTLLESKTLSFKTADSKTKYRSTKRGVLKGISFPH